MLIKVFDQKIPVKIIKPKKDDILIHFIYSPERSAIQPKRLGAKILLIWNNESKVPICNALNDNDFK